MGKFRRTFLLQPLGSLEGKIYRVVCVPNRAHRVRLSVCIISTASVIIYTQSCTTRERAGLWGKGLG